jgi:hypothetical protein
VSHVNLFELLWFKLLIYSVIFQVLSVNCIICFPLLAHSLFHYVFIYLCSEPSNKVERLVTKVANQGFQLVVFSNTFVGGYPRGNAFGNKSATSHKNNRKKLKTYSKHVTFYKVSLCKEPCLKNHVSRTRTHNNKSPCN